MLSGMATADTAVVPKATARGTTVLNPFMMVVVKVVLELKYNCLLCKKWQVVVNGERNRTALESDCGVYD